jgi:hypothetical protein
MHGLYTRLLIVALALPLSCAVRPVEDTYPTLEGLKNTLEIQATFDPRAAKVKLEDFVDLRFVEEMKKSGFIAKLYGNH